jgi:GWxTD domain-containing protein
LKRVWLNVLGVSLVLILFGLEPSADCPAGTADSERTLRELVAAHPDSALLYARLASVCFAKGTAHGRLWAVEYMKMALKHDPRNNDYRLILAEMYFESTFWDKGVREIKELLKLDPENGFAHLRLGEAYLERAVEEWQRSRFIDARDELELVDEAHLAYPGACRRLARCYYDLSKPDSAIALLGRLPEDSLSVDDLVLRGMAHREVNDLEAASDDFTRALAAMDETRRDRYMSAELIATPEELKQAAKAVLRTGPDSPGGMIWKKRDPNPATEVNERLIEHLARVGFADLHFSVPRLGKVGSETARGEVYIRYGRPLAWRYDPFGSGVFADETTMPRPAGMPNPMAGEDGWEDFESQDRGASLRSRPSGQSRPRWRWEYEGFSLDFEDTFMNGNFDFPYESRGSAYVYAFLEKNVPEIYESQIKKRMRVVLDALNVVDDTGRPYLKLVYGCDTRGVRYQPPYEWPVGDFDVEVAVLDSTYGDLARSKFTTELKADSSALYQTMYPLIGSLRVQVPPGSTLAAVSIESEATGAIGFTNRPVRVRALGDSLAISDIEIRFAEDGPPNPAHVYLGRGKAYLAFSIHNLTTDARGMAGAKVSYRLVEKRTIRPGFRRLLEAVTGRSSVGPSRGLTSVWSSYELKSRGPEKREVLGIELKALSTGDYKVEIEVTDAESGRAATATTGFTIVSEIGR